MCKILAFEADRRAFNITINSFGTDLTKDDRLKVRRCSRGRQGLHACADRPLFFSFFFSFFSFFSFFFFFFFSALVVAITASRPHASFSQLYPTIGRLYPEGLSMLSDCSDYDEVVRVVEYYAEYRGMFEGVGTGPGEKTLEDKFFEYEVRFWDAPATGAGAQAESCRGASCVCAARTPHDCAALTPCVTFKRPLPPLLRCSPA